MKAINPFVCVAAIAVAGLSFNASADEFRAPRLGVVCETPAQARPGVAKSRAWEQSLLTGNGAMGAMVPGWLFNIDISGGFPGIIADALITKGPDGGFQVLNAKPASWNRGSISGLLLPGGIKVKNLSWQGDSYELELIHPDGRITAQRK